MRKIILWAGVLVGLVAAMLLGACGESTPPANAGVRTVAATTPLLTVNPVTSTTTRPEIQATATPSPAIATAPSQNRATATPQSQSRRITTPAGTVTSGSNLRDYGTTVNMHGKLTNEDAKLKFLTGYTAGVPGRWEVIAYTIEGDPVSFELRYEGKGSQVKLRHDNTQDKFSAQADRVVRDYTCQQMSREKEMLHLMGCQDKNGVAGDVYVP